MYSQMPSAIVRSPNLDYGRIDDSIDFVNFRSRHHRDCFCGSDYLTSSFESVWIYVSSQIVETILDHDWSVSGYIRPHLMIAGYG